MVKLIQNIEGIMMMRGVYGLFLGVFVSPLYAFQCYFTLAKDNCWLNYTVNVQVIDAATQKPIASIVVPKGKPWGRVAFTCEASQKLMYQATFTPIFWKSDEGKQFYAQKYWTLPDVANPKDTAWEIPVCFPSAFASVPFPPDAIAACACDFKSIPPIQPIKPE
jgi:hypothetical protein